jgi:Leucine-rich repeat (LRR) protein
MNPPEGIIDHRGLLLTYESYLRWINTDQTWKQRARTMPIVHIYDSGSILILKGQELPFDAVLFKEMGTLSEFKNVKELYLGSLYITDVPDSFAQLQELERLVIAFTANAKLKHAIAVLSQLRSLKRMDIDASTLTNAKRKSFMRSMEEKGVFFDSMFFNETVKRPRK